MNAAGLRPLVTKEIRALLPAWIGAALAIGAAVLSGGRSHELGLIAYAFGSVVLGAQSVGHEYTHRTMAQLLSQPWSRRRLLAVKLTVLTTMVATLAAFAWLALLQPGEEYWVFATLLNALCLAPLLTMAARDPMAGVVFTGAAPVWLLLLGRYISAQALWAGTFAVAAAAAIAGWRMFMRLEAIDGRGAEMRAPEALRRWLAATLAASSEPVRTKRPVWMLVKKELHLQQMTFAVTAVWMVFWIVESASTRLVPGFVGLPLAVVAVLFGALEAMLIGSLASAEERQLGTHDWQVLLPMAAWRQWFVKAGTALGLAAVLSLGLPVLLGGGGVAFNAWYSGVIVFLTAGSLYVSSLCRSGLRALIVSAALLLAASMIVPRIAPADARPAAALFGVPAAAVVILMLWFAFENHRLAGQSTVRVVRQAMWIGGCLGVGAAVVGLLERSL
jgi:hypothetical protein